MSSYGELVLVIGDFHIPHRAADINEQFKKLLLPNRMNHVLCTGNLCTRDQADYLKTIAPRVHIVRGDFDEDEKLPEDKVVTIGDFKIGLIHGHQIAPFGEVDALAAVRRRLDCDVLIHGFSPQSSITEYGSHAYVCPGSVTGALLPGVPLSAAGAAATATTPSFMLLNVMAGKIEFFKYELGAGDKLKISRSMFMKGSAASAPPSASSAAAVVQKV